MRGVIDTIFFHTHQCIRFWLSQVTLHVNTVLLRKQILNRRQRINHNKKSFKSPLADFILILFNATVIVTDKPPTDSRFSLRVFALRRLRCCK